MNKRPKVMHNLPEDVIYCKKCVMSNQRPATTPEFTKKSTSDIEMSTFGEDGVCDACRFHEFKKTIDWLERGAQLEELCNKYRRNDGRYDVIVPGSGGKDSIAVSHILKEKYKMNPLTVTWAPHAYTNVGVHNLEAWRNMGFDNILVTPNPKIHRLLTKLAFENLVNPFQPFIIGQKNTAPRYAAMYDIPFVMYGENNAESHNAYYENLSPIMDPRHYVSSGDSELYFGGLSESELHERYNFNPTSLASYKPISQETHLNSKIEVHFMSYYYNWSPQQNYYLATEVSDFESNWDGRTEGTYTKFTSLDDKLDGQYYYTALIKFGQGRAMNDACRDIRDGYISREEGIELVKLYDTEFPERYFEFFLEYIGITKDHYFEVIDAARSPHLWTRNADDWVLRHPPV